MKRLSILALCLLSLVVLADRRGQIMSQRAPASGGGGPTPPTSNPPGIWLDVLQYVTNSTADATVVTTYTNYGVFGGFFYSGSTTNYTFETNSGGYFTAVAGAGAGAFWSPASGTNTQQYFQTNFGTIAYRVLQANFNHSPGPIQTGSDPPTVGAHYAYVQFSGGTVFFDWGESTDGPNRISQTAPSDGLNIFLNFVYVKSNDLMQIWINGTNWLQGTGKTALIQATNIAAGPLVFWQDFGFDQKQVKRILMWRYALTPSEITSLDTWMTAMP